MLCQTCRLVGECFFGRRTDRLPNRFRFHVAARLAKIPREITAAQDHLGMRGAHHLSGSRHHVLVIADGFVNVA